jgi:phosphoribosyl-ATP pyrophosphohydrolase
MGEAMWDEVRAIRKLLRDDSPEDTLLRILKVHEEAGEVASDVITYRGGNPRKASHSVGSTAIATELCDVIIAAMVALQDWTGDPESLLHRLANERLDRVRNLCDGDDMHAG